MSSYLNQLAEIAHRQGKPFTDPTRIQGFGEGNPPPPPLPPDTELPNIPSARDLHGEPVETPEPEIESPLIKAALQARPRISVEETELWVMNDNATYRGRSVQLKDTEKAGITKIILKAIRRSLDEQYQELTGGKRPRSSRGTGPKVSEPASGKRRGRRSGIPSGASLE